MGYVCAIAIHVSSTGFIDVKKCNINFVEVAVKYQLFRSGNESCQISVCSDLQNLY